VCNKNVAGIPAVWLTSSVEVCLMTHQDVIALLNHSRNHRSGASSAHISHSFPFSIYLAVKMNKCQVQTLVLPQIPSFVWSLFQALLSKNRHVAPTTTISFRSIFSTSLYTKEKLKFQFYLQNQIETSMKF